MCVAMLMACSQNPLDSPAVCNIDIALSIMVWLNHSAFPFCYGVPGVVRRCSIPLWLRMSLTLAAMYLPPLLECRVCNFSEVWVSAQERNFCSAATNWSFDQRQ